MLLLSTSSLYKKSTSAMAPIFHPLGNFDGKSQNSECWLRQFQAEEGTDTSGKELPPLEWLLLFEGYLDGKAARWAYKNARVTRILADPSATEKDIATVKRLFLRKFQPVWAQDLDVPSKFHKLSSIQQGEQEYLKAYYTRMLSLLMEIGAIICPQDKYLVPCGDDRNFLPAVQAFLAGLWDIQLSFVMCSALDVMDPLQSIYQKTRRMAKHRGVKYREKHWTGTPTPVLQEEEPGFLALSEMLLLSASVEGWLEKPSLPMEEPSQMSLSPVEKSPKDPSCPVKSPPNLAVEKPLWCGTEVLPTPAEVVVPLEKSWSTMPEIFSMLVGVSLVPVEEWLPVDDPLLPMEESLWNAKDLSISTTVVELAPAELEPGGLLIKKSNSEGLLPKELEPGGLSSKKSVLGQTLSEKPTGLFSEESEKLPPDKPGLRGSYRIHMDRQSQDLSRSITEILVLATLFQYLCWRFHHDDKDPTKLVRIKEARGPRSLYYICRAWRSHEDDKDLTKLVRIKEACDPQSTSIGRGSPTRWWGTC